MTLKESVYHFRVKLGMTQQELADKVGVSQRSICAYEMGSRTPTVGVLKNLSTVFGCTIDELIDGPGEQSKAKAR